MAGTFTWNAGTLGLWSDPASWIGPGGAPGSTDTAIIDIPISPFPSVTVAVVQGPGDAEVLETRGTVVLDGTVSAARATFGVGGFVGIGAGDVLNAGTMSSLGTLLVNSGSVDVSGDAAVSGALTIRNGATFRASNLVLADTRMTFDATSILEIGVTGVNAPGTVVVGAGASLHVTARTADYQVIINTILNDGTISSDVGPFVSTTQGFAIQAGVNNGVMSNFNMVGNSGVGLFGPLSGLVNNGTILSGGETSLENVTGPGTLALTNDGTFVIADSVTGTVDLAASNTSVILFDNSTGELPQGTTLILRDFGTDDRLLLRRNLTGASYRTLSPSEGRLDLTTATSSISLLVEGTYAASPLLEFASGSEVRVQDGQFLVVCFVSGTRLGTPTGPVAIEDLRPGDRLLTCVDGSTRPIRWIGHRALDLTRHPEPEVLYPVLIESGALGDGVPCRDLRLSPDHALYHDGALIPVKHLVNGISVRRLPVAHVTYWHVELDRHDVILAEGVPAESYLDVGDRVFFANGGGVVSLHPALPALAREAHACAPLVVTGPILDRLRDRMASRVRIAAA